MNIAFFLTPKSDVVYLNISATMRQALEKMEYHRYAAIPLLDEDGHYVATLTEGDLLWKMKHTPNLSFNNCDKIQLKDVPKHVVNQPVKITESIDSLLTLALTQNFIPVVDDGNYFIGIIKRHDIINYGYSIIADTAKESNHP